jgi:hypothetical protein
MRRVSRGLCTLRGGAGVSAASIRFSRCPSAWTRGPTPLARPSGRGLDGREEPATPGKCDGSPLAHQPASKLAPGRYGPRLEQPDTAAGISVISLSREPLTQQLE